jgi:hypothetical protein
MRDFCWSPVLSLFWFSRLVVGVLLSVVPIVPHPQQVPLTMPAAGRLLNRETIPTFGRPPPPTQSKTFAQNQVLVPQISEQVVEPTPCVHPVPEDDFSVDPSMRTLKSKIRE